MHGVIRVRLAVRGKFFYSNYIHFFSRRFVCNNNIKLYNTGARRVLARSTINKGKASGMAHEDILDFEGLHEI